MHELNSGILVVGDCDTDSSGDYVVQDLKSPETSVSNDRKALKFSLYTQSEIIDSGEGELKKQIDLNGSILTIATIHCKENLNDVKKVSFIQGEG